MVTMVPSDGIHYALFVTLLPSKDETEGAS